MSLLDTRVSLHLRPHLLVSYVHASVCTRAGAHGQLSNTRPSTSLCDALSLARARALFLFSSLLVPPPLPLHPPSSSLAPSLSLSHRRISRATSSSARSAPVRACGASRASPCSRARSLSVSVCTSARKRALSCSSVPVCAGCCAAPCSWLPADKLEMALRPDRPERAVDTRPGGAHGMRADGPNVSALAHRRRRRLGDYREQKLAAASEKEAGAGPLSRPQHAAGRIKVRTEVRALKSGIGAV